MSAAVQRVDLVARARDAWGEPPEWVVELAEACMRTSQRQVAARIGYSSSVLSQTISRTYAGDMSLVEERVRGALLQVTVACPMVGEMGRNVCLDWQKKPFAATSGNRVKMYRACRSGCPHSRLPKEF